MKQNKDGTMTTTSVYMPADMIEVLRAVAQRRQKLHGGRSSVSHIIVALVTEKMPELRREVSVSV